MGRKKKDVQTRKSQKQRWTRAKWGAHSLAIRDALPYLSPFNSETYVSVLLEGWCTPSQPLLPFDIHQRARLGQPTSLTFMCPSDSTVRSIVNTRVGCITACMCVGVDILSVTCQICTHSMLLQCIYRQTQQIETFLGEKCCHQHFSFFFYLNMHVVHIILDPGDNRNIFTCVLVCSGKSSYKTTPNFI